MIYIIIIFIIAIVFVIYASFEARWLQLKHIVIKDKRIPASFDSKEFLICWLFHYRPNASLKYFLSKFDPLTTTQTGPRFISTFPAKRAEIPAAPAGSTTR